MARSAFPIINVVDLRRVQGFYERLGFVETYRFPDEGEPAFVTLERDGSVIGIGADGGTETEADRFGLWLYVDDVDAALDRLEAAGATVEATPQNQPWGERVARVRDPAGNLVYLGAPR